jgi:hypothetical protein
LIHAKAKIVGENLAALLVAVILNVVRQDKFVVGQPVVTQMLLVAMIIVVM